jgi:hypothetical protein
MWVNSTDYGIKKAYYVGPQSQRSNVRLLVQTLKLTLENLGGIISLALFTFHYLYQRHFFSSSYLSFFP